MSDSRDYKLDISGLTPAEESSSRGRPFLSVMFACCSVYQRIYRNSQGTAYSGRCPKCGKPVNFKVGGSGTDSRQFVVY